MTDQAPEPTKEENVQMNDYTGEPYDRVCFVRILVTGATTYTNKERIKKAIGDAVQRIRHSNSTSTKPIMIIATGKTGVEQLALQCAQELRCNWADLPERSKDMDRAEVAEKTLTYHRPHLVMCFTDQKTSGETWDLIQQCDIKGIHVRIYPTKWED